MHSDLLIRNGADRHSDMIRQASGPHEIHQSELPPADRRIARLWRHFRLTRAQQPSAQPARRPAVEA
jgi:hypothetical protein